MGSVRQGGGTFHSQVSDEETEARVSPRTKGSGPSDWTSQPELLPSTLQPPVGPNLPNLEKREGEKQSGKRGAADRTSERERSGPTFPLPSSDPGHPSTWRALPSSRPSTASASLRAQRDASRPAASIPPAAPYSSPQPHPHQGPGRAQPAARPPEAIPRPPDRATRTRLPTRKGPSLPPRRPALQGLPRGLPGGARPPRAGRAPGPAAALNFGRSRGGGGGRGTSAPSRCAHQRPSKTGGPGRRGPSPPAPPQPLLLPLPLPSRSAPPLRGPGRPQVRVPEPVQLDPARGPSYLCFPRIREADHAGPLTGRAARRLEGQRRESSGREPRPLARGVVSAAPPLRGVPAPQARASARLPAAPSPACGPTGRVRFPCTPAVYSVGFLSHFPHLTDEKNEAQRG